MKTNNNTNNNDLTRTKKYKKVNKKKSNVIDFQEELIKMNNDKINDINDIISKNDRTI